MIWISVSTFPWLVSGCNDISIFSSCPFTSSHKRSLKPILALIGPLSPLHQRFAQFLPQCRSHAGRPVLLLQTILLKKAGVNVPLLVIYPGKICMHSCLRKYGDLKGLSQIRQVDEGKITDFACSHPEQKFWILYCQSLRKCFQQWTHIKISKCGERYKVNDFNENRMRKASPENVLSLERVLRPWWHLDKALEAQ